MTCEERRLHIDPAEQERLFNEWMARNRVTRCPDCGCVIEKIDGCNHMACRCGAHFCWQCGEAYKSSEIYDHMRNAHGGIYTEIPEWANTDEDVVAVAQQPAPRPQPHVGVQRVHNERREAAQNRDDTECCCIVM